MMTTPTGAPTGAPTTTITTTRVLSFDIGITNLAYCVLEKGTFSEPTTKQGYRILHWDLICLFPEDHLPPPSCQGTHKNNTPCTHQAIYQEEGGIFLCRKHSTPTSKEIKKKKKKAKTPLQISERLYLEFQKRETEFAGVNYVLVESQPVNKNPTMKTVQMLIFSYFAYQRMRDPTLREVGIVHAKRKEKLPDQDKDWKGSLYEKTYEERILTIKDAYKRRKIKCLEYAKLCLNNYPEKRTCLEEHEKQDDLCDAFLQGCVWLQA